MEATPPRTAMSRPAERPGDAAEAADATDATDATEASLDDASLHRFEVFLFSAIATVLAVRTFLAVTGYPKVGGGDLHVAHVLWGGLLMGVAVVMGLTGTGSRIRTTAAFVGGIGFGLFIDEVGKFLTTDVNYFYAPAVAIIYIVFVVFYLVVRQLLLRRTLTDRRRVALATTAIADQALGQLSEKNRRAAQRLLADVEVPNEATRALGVALASQPVAKRRFQAWLDAQRERGSVVLRRLAVNPVVQLLAFAFVAWQVGRRVSDYVTYLQITIDLERLNAAVDQLNADTGAATTGSLGFGFGFWYELVANLAVAAVAAVGVVLAAVPWTRRWGLRVLSWGLLLDILLNQFGTFEYSQFGALVGFGIELVLLLGIRYLLRSNQIPDIDQRLLARWRARRRSPSAAG